MIAHPRAALGTSCGAACRALAVYLVLLTCESRAQQYTLTLLEDLPEGPVSGAGYAINTAGTVVGEGATSGRGAEGAAHPTVWFGGGGAAVDLGLIPEHIFGTALGINDENVIVGRCNNGPAPHRAFRWTQSDGLVDLGTPIGYSGAMATAINSTGWIVGSASFATSSEAFLWRPGVGYSIIGDLSGGFIEGQAFAINDSGGVAGSGSMEFGWRAFSWTLAGGFVQLADLPGTLSSQALAINNSGECAGVAAIPGNAQRAVLWSADGMTASSLGLLPAYTSAIARGMNDGGTIVGNVFGAPPPRAFIWDATLGMRDLNNLVAGGTNGWTLSIARDVHNNGRIVGEATNGALRRAFLLLPPSQPCPPDVNSDGVIDQGDLAALLSNYGMSSGAQHQDGDIDGDADVDQADLAALLGQYGQACP